MNKKVMIILVALSFVLISCTQKKEKKTDVPQVNATEQTHECGGCSKEQECDSNLKLHEDEEIVWMKNIDEALKTAKETNKLLMVDFMAEWCPPCKKMEKVTFTDHNVICKSENFITVRIDVDEQQEVANAYNGNAGKYGGIGIPNILFIDKDKNVKRHIIGFHEPQKLVSVMDSVLTGKYDE